MFSHWQRVANVMLVTVAFVCSAVEPSLAQRRGRGGMRAGNVTAVQLVQLDDVQQELELTSEQVEKINAIYETLAVGRGQVMSTIAKESGQRGPKLKELNEKANADATAALDETQQKRLRELLLQVNGAAGLYDAEIQTTLKLTDEQKEKLADIRRDAAKARRTVRADVSGDRWTAMVELQNDTNAKLLDVLTPEQQKQFEQMQGEKIEIDLYGNWRIVGNRAAFAERPLVVLPG